MVYTEIAIVIALILVNGLLAMSELAVVSSRPMRLIALRETGFAGAARALALMSNPGRFLSTVQIGITLVGVLSGAFSGATLGQRLASTLGEMGVPPGTAATLGIGGVVAVITYASLIVGELVPKQIALRNPERIASLVAPAMHLLATLAAPLVWLLDLSGRTVLRLLGQSGENASQVTDEEIRALIAEAEQHGTIDAGERKMISGVMRFADRNVRSVMTPRTRVEWIDLEDEPAAIEKELLNAQHALLPAAEGSIDAMVGVIRTRDALSALLAGGPLRPADLVHRVPVVHDNARAINMLATLREAEVAIALVHDEYGHFEGIVTPADVLETITGVFRADAEDDEPDAVRRDDGSWLIAGDMQADEMAELLAIKLPPRRDFETVAGFILAELHHLPETGETLEAHGWRFEIVDLDSRRIDKVLASRLSGPPHEE